MADLREQLIRLAYNKRHLRSHLLPLLAEDEVVIREVSEGGIDENEIRNVLAIPEEDRLSDHYTPEQALEKLIEKLGEDEAKKMVRWTSTMTHAPFYEKMEDLIS